MFTSTDYSSPAWWQSMMKDGCGNIRSMKDSCYTCNTDKGCNTATEAKIWFQDSLMLYLQNAYNKHYDIHYNIKLTHCSQVCQHLEGNVEKES